MLDAVTGPAPTLVAAWLAALLLRREERKA
jgi:hypothetical protein